MRSDTFDVVVLGAGAAGMFAAAIAGKRGCRVALLDHAEQPGKKILISGGGRCNFTNVHTSAENFLSNNPHFCKSALASYTPDEFVALVESYGIAYHEKELGQLFCDGSARQIVSMLERECSEAKVTTLLGTKVIRVDTGFAIECEQHGELLRLQNARLVIATGGLSIPKMGASGVGYDIARQFGLAVVEPRPALVPLVFDAEMSHAFSALAGVSLAAHMRVGNADFAHRLLFTHRGVSGPAVLQASSYWSHEEPVAIDLLPEKNVTSKIMRSPGHRDEKSLRHALQQHWPERLVDAWLAQYKPLRWDNHSLQAFEEAIHNWRWVPAGTEGFAKAEVTAGGVDTSGLNAKTMAAKRTPGLYFIGEVVDVTGWLGGYNFQWAWASAAAAARAL